jgi:amino acid adenylation domain-containing protein
MVPDSPAYNVALEFTFDGDLVPELLAEAFNVVVGRHEILRTTFADDGGEPWQAIAPSLTIALPLVDLSQAAEPDDDFALLAGAEARHLFDLAVGPLLRVVLVRFGARSHRLVLTMHHIIVDAWSGYILLREVMTAYDALVAGEPVDLAPLRVQYADFTRWERDRLQGPVLDRKLTYWRQQLGTERSGLELPLDRPRPAVQTFRGGNLRFRLDAELVAGLRSLSEGHDVTLFMSLVSALNVLLHRYSGADDIVIGTPAASRHHTDIEALIGFFVNTVVLRTSLVDDPSFPQLLRRVKDVATNAYAHQDVPFELLVRELLPDRGMSMNPLFQVCFALQPNPRERWWTGSLLTGGAEIRNGTCKFDLWISLTEQVDGFSGEVEYSTDIFEHTTIERIIDAYQTLLRSIVDDPARRVSELPMLAAEEEHQILVEWNNTARTFDDHREACLHELVEDAVDRWPANVAVRFGDESLTFAELDRRANRLAHRLIRAGVEPDQPVGICAERSIEMVVGLLGILKAGGAYVPIDPTYPPARLAFLLDDAGPRILLTQRRLVEAMPGHGSTVILLDDDRDDRPDDADDESTDRPTSGVGLDNSAYLIYTSGSTGQPKAAMISHRAIRNRILWMQSEYCLTPEDRVLQKTPFSFDVSVWEFFWPLLTGACMVVAKPEGHKDPAYLTRLIQDAMVTTLHFVPSMLQPFLEAPDVELCRSVRRVFASGEALSPVLVARHYRRLPDARLYNLYGPTEAAVDVTHWPCPSGYDVTTVPIGRPIANTSIYVLDRHRNPVPIGAAGELYIGGVQVARGYHRRAELTHERFVADPFAAVPGATMYRTGDLARFLPDGNIVYLGRTDFQVKLRGLRIEPGEIEAALAQHPAVREAVVLARTTGDDDHAQLVAYVVPDDGEEGVAGRVAEWERVFDRTYGDGEPVAEADFNIVGWASSYTGEPLPAEQMRTWVESTVDRILEYEPRRVLELGCGTGLLLARVAPSTSLYCGTDLSATALDYLRDSVLRGLPDTVRVGLHQGAADDLEGLDEGDFDMVILNSVVQYFPSWTYLRDVLAGAVRRVRPGGVVFVGDVRNFSLLKAFHVEVELARAEIGLTAGQLRRRVVQRLHGEEELVLDPRLFTLLRRDIPEVRDVRVLLKRGTHHNELTRYRYDVVLRIGEPVEAVEPGEVQRLTTTSVDEVRDVLVRSEPDTVLVTGVPNARVARVDGWLTALAEAPDDAIIEDMAPRVREPGVEPEDWWRLAAELGYRADVSWDLTATDGRYQVLLYRAGRPGADCAVDGAPRRYANNPMAAQRGRQLTQVLRAFLADKLPEFMIPTAVVAIAEIPTDANGKLDRGALPVPQRGVDDTVDYLAPRDREEEALATIWADVLGVDKVSVAASFFALGGDSLLAIRMAGRATAAGMSLTPQDVFQSKTIADLSDLVRSRELASAEPVGPPTSDVGGSDLLSRLRTRFADAEDAYPATGTQAHIVRRTQSSRDPGGNVIHHRFRIAGNAFDPMALERAWQHTIDLYPALRTSYVWDGDVGLVQVVRGAARLVMDRHDWRSIGSAEQQRRLHAYIAERRRRGFDPERPLQMHVALFRLTNDEYEYIYLFSLAEHDGWSYMIIMRTLLDAYEAIVAGAEPDPAPVGRVFGAFCAAQSIRDATDAERFWRAELAGRTLPMPVLALPSHLRDHDVALPYHQETLVLPEATAAALLAMARRNDLTVHTIVQGCWALLLSAVAGQPDVVFGAVFSGRSDARMDVEAAVGQFFNILPVCVHVDEDERLSTWLARLQMKVASIGRYEHVPPRRLFELAGVDEEDFLFETYVVNETFPELESNFARFHRLLGATPVEFINQTEHPVRVEAAFANASLLININHYAGYFAPGQVARWLRVLGVLISSAAEPEDPVLGGILAEARAELGKGDG